MLTPSIPHRPTHPSTISNYLRPPSLLHTNRTKSNAAKPSQTTTPLPSLPPSPPAAFPLGSTYPPPPGSTVLPGTPSLPSLTQLIQIPLKLRIHRALPPPRPKPSPLALPHERASHHTQPNTERTTGSPGAEGKEETDRQAEREGGGGRKNQKSERGGCQGECSE